MAKGKTKSVEKTAGEGESFRRTFQLDIQEVDGIPSKKKEGSLVHDVLTQLADIKDGKTVCLGKYEKKGSAAGLVQMLRKNHTLADGRDIFSVGRDGAVYVTVGGNAAELLANAEKVAAQRAKSRAKNE